MSVCVCVCCEIIFTLFKSFVCPSHPTSTPQQHTLFLSPSFCLLPYSSFFSSHHPTYPPAFAHPHRLTALSPPFFAAPQSTSFNAQPSRQEIIIIPSRLTPPSSLLLFCDGQQAASPQCTFIQEQRQISHSRTHTHTHTLSLFLSLKPKRVTE